ncbi:isoleucine--tRNA ligase [Candidatus Uhrbacteria bacterium]|nr:isoleucine--tRNA ligase [Candidatus Uhrbacteria bacterium]
MSISEREQKIIEFWEQNSIFQRSVQERSESTPYVFYDGPPFATGLPHYGHLVASLMKDIVPRYWTMRGKRVERVWGWDCHGLPIENIVEEQLTLRSKKDIELYGVARFNEACRSQVLAYAEEWKKTIRRLGRWVDMEHPYMTMDRDYMESVWWVFSELWKKGLIYEGKKAMHICPRCVTTLSNFEVTQGYKEITDRSATVRFSALNVSEKLGINTPLDILAWTTTPWTLPGNVLLAVGNDIEYAVGSFTGVDGMVLLACERIQAYEEKLQSPFALHSKHRGRELVGLGYTPLFPYFSDTPRAFRVVAADFVSTEEGTGVVHIAPAFGEDDYLLGQEENVGFVQHVTPEGVFTKTVSDFADMPVKSKDDPSRTDRMIIAWLRSNGRLLLDEPYTHTYPHCWRCDTPLLNYATTSWFVRVTELRDELLKNNEKIEWVPEHMKEGRFGRWLEGARDWAISRSRYWGAPLPIWKSDDGDIMCIGSVQELEQLCGSPVADIHKHIVDEIAITKNDKQYRRVPEVLDCWFESGSMPYGQAHYPFENKEAFERGFPAEFIAEGQDQTRGWFYTLHVLATALTRQPNPSIPKPKSVPAFLHVIVNGIVLAEDGKKMSKRLKNYPDPSDIFERYGADALRLYLASSPVMHAENLNFSEAGVKEVYNKFVNTVFNVAQFLSLFPPKEAEAVPANLSVLDRWIFSRLAQTHERVTHALESYRIAQAIPPLLSFMTDLSTWYVRRSRDRFKSSDENTGAGARATLCEVLHTTSLMIAPITPFIAEEIYQIVRKARSEDAVTHSVHLEQWPDDRVRYYDEALQLQMERVRELAEVGHALRAQAKIKVRQPLSAVQTNVALSSELDTLLCEELNVKEVRHVDAPLTGEQWITKQERDFFVALDTALTAELQQEGMQRELIRQINAYRKEKGLTIHDYVNTYLYSEDDTVRAFLEQQKEEIARATLSRDIHIKPQEGAAQFNVNDNPMLCFIDTVSSVDV